MNGIRVRFGGVGHALKPPRPSLSHNCNTLGSKVIKRSQGFSFIGVMLALLLLSTVGLLCARLLFGIGQTALGANHDQNLQREQAWALAVGKMIPTENMQKRETESDLRLEFIDHHASHSYWIVLPRASEEHQGQKQSKIP